MIEREFVNQKKKEYQIQQFISATLKNVGHSFTELQRTPLGEKVIIHTSRPGLIVGRKGQNISRLTDVLRTKFKLENPTVEISEVEAPNLDPNIVAEKIASSLERFGSNRFKGAMHKAMADVLGAGARGVEIRLSGKLPSSRAKSWRVYGGYLKKCGDAAISNVRKATIVAKLKAGVIGIQVSILPQGIIMPDTIRLIEDVIETPSAEAKETAETAEEKPAEAKETKEEKPAKKPRKKKAATKKKPSAKEEAEK